MVIDCNAIPAEEKKDTTIIEPVVETVHEAETDAHEGSALPENENKTPLISLPQSHHIPISEAPSKSDSEMEVPVGSSEETKIIKEVTAPSEASEKIEEPATSSEDEGKVEPTEGEEKGEESTLTGHQRGEHPAA